MNYSKYVIFFLALVMFSGADAVAPTSRRMMSINTNDRTGCFPQKLWGFLGEVQNRFGRIEIVSGHRGSAANRRRGGAKGSLHVRCMAADFRVPGVNPDTVRSYLSNTFVGRAGVGFYCNDRFHLDVGTPRVWGGCIPFNKNMVRSRYRHDRGRPTYNTNYYTRKSNPPTYRRTGRYSYESDNGGSSER